MSRTRSEWLVVNVYEGGRLIHDDGRESVAADADGVLGEVFGAFVSGNCLQPPDLAPIRAEVLHGTTVLAVLDGRDW